MAEEFLTLMADLDDESQKLMGSWYNKLKEKGFIGVQTPNLPFHISLGCFSLDKEDEVVKEMKELAGNFSEIPVHFSHIGLFEGGKVLFTDTIQKAMLVLVDNFHAFRGKITKLHLCAFWPTREIAKVPLGKNA